MDKFAKLYDHEKRFAAMRDAGPALYDALRAMVAEHILRGPFDEPLGSSEQPVEIIDALAALNQAEAPNGN